MFKYNMVKYLIQRGAKKIVNRLKSKILLKFDVVFEYHRSQDDKNYVVKLKIGENNTYKIDNIKAFLLAIKYKNPLDVRDLFTYVPENYGFRKRMQSS